MCTNIPVTEVKRIMKEILNNNNHTSENKKTLTVLLNTSWNETTHSLMTNSPSKMKA
jgi:hypothetical protein